MGILGDIFSGVVKDLRENDERFDIICSGLEEVKRDLQMEMGLMKLSDAIREAPNESGVYKLYCDGELKYGGIAEYRLRDRFRQHYDGDTIREVELLVDGRTFPLLPPTSASVTKKIFEHRDEIIVTWEVCNLRRAEPHEVIQRISGKLELGPWNGPWNE